MPMLRIEYFNPVVDDWTPEFQEEERRQKEICKYQLYVITPRMTGVFSIAEIIESVHTEDVVTLVYIMTRDKAFDDNDEYIEFDNAQLKSLKAVTDLAESHGAIICSSLEDVASKLNGNG